MDDSLEAPDALPLKTPTGDLPPDENEESSGDEEEGALDWSKLVPVAARPVIPRRGEKEFEPRAGGGSNLQLHVLDRSRSAMFEALKATRTTSSKVISYGIWHPRIARTEVTVARGIHFSAMGHSAPRAITGKDGVEKVQKRIELLPEEAIYLIERGSLFCWKEMDLDLSKVPGLDDVAGSPMTVQQAYTEMVGAEDLTLEKFQVFAYLRRLGYMVTRTKPPSPCYPTPSPRPATTTTTTISILQRISSLFPRWMSWLSKLFTPAFSWWKPVHISRWLQHDKNYGSLFRSLRFMPAGHGVPLQIKTDRDSAESRKAASPYQIFYNLYKPSTSFKKSAPPQPDFQIVVINARTTPMPTLQELTDLFGVLPELPIPMPRQRRPVPGAPVAKAPAVPAPAAPLTTPATSDAPPASDAPIVPDITLSSTAAAPTTQSAPSTIPVRGPLPPYRHFNAPTPAQPSLIRRFFPWAFSAVPAQQVQVRRPNPFMVLKQGKKIIIIAAVDAGSISFFRFGQGAFTEWPMA